MPVIPSIQSLVGAHSGGSKAAVDWFRTAFFQIDGTWLSRYGVLSGLEENFVSISNFGGTGKNLNASMPGLASDGHLGLSIGVDSNGSGLATADPTSFALIDYLPYPSVFGTGGMTGVTKNSAQFFVDKGVGNTVISTLNRISYTDDGTTYLGFSDFAGAGGRCCAGPAGSGTAYILSPLVGGIEKVNLSKVVFNGVTWTGTTSIADYVPTDIDAGWSALNLNGVCLDQTDGKLLVVFWGIGNSNKAYLTKLDPSDGSIVWKTVIPSTDGGGQVIADDIFQYSRIRNQRVGFYTGSPATVTIYNTATGAVDTTYSTNLAGMLPTPGGQCYDDTLGAIIFNIDFVQFVNSPTLLNSTPSSWSAGWAVLYVAAGIAPANPRRFLAVSGPIRDIQLGPPTPPDPPIPPTPPTNAVGAIGLDIAVAGVGVAGSIGTIALNMDVAGVGFGGDGVSTGTIGLNMAVSGASSSGPSSALTPWTITELNGSAQTNVPIEIWVPFSASGGAYPFASGDAIQILDSDGVTVIPCQEDNRSSDLAANVRGVKITAILPSLGVRQAKQLTVRKLSSTAPDTGTDITVADILATGFTFPISLPFDNGTTYTADAATGLAASTWTNKTTAANTGKWRTGGGLVTEYICYCPFKNAGAATPDTMGAWFTVSAYKSGRGAVGGGNPIIAIKVQYWLECGWLQASRTAIRNHWFDLTATSGTNSQAWVGSSPSMTLTLSSAGSNGATVLATVPTATFTQNSVGQVISDGTGQALITGYSNSTTVTCRISNPMSGTSIAAGNWRIFGANHQFASKFPMQELWFGGSPATKAKPNIDSSLGVAWNPVSLTGGPFTYWRDCGMVLPYTTPASAITNSLANLNANGTNPTGMGSNLAGDITLYLPQTGGRDDIAPIPGWDVGGMIRADANGKTRIMGNSLKWSLCPIFYRNENTGKAMLLNNGTDYSWDPAWFGTVVPQGNSYVSGTNCQDLTAFTPQVAHHPGEQYVSWLYTGDFYWVESRQQQIFWLWTENNPGYWGSQLNRVFCTSSELRGNGWSFRDLMQGIMMTPDRSPSVLGYSRTHLQTAYDNQFTATNSGVAGGTPSPGINIQCINNTGVGKTYATSGYRDMGGGGGGLHSLWQLGYMGLAFFQCQGMGMTSTYAENFMTWFMEGLTGPSTSTAVTPNWIAPSYYMNTTTFAGSNVNSWQGVFYSLGSDPTQYGLNKRIITGTGITLSGLTGPLTVTMPAGYFTTGGNLYIGGLIRDLNAASLQAVPTVSAGGSGYSISDTIDLLISNAASSFTVTTKARVTVSAVSGGAVTAVTLTDPGLYIANSAGSYGITGSSATQFATSGGGSGAVFSIAYLDVNYSSAGLRFGMGNITNVSGNVLTLSTTGHRSVNGEVQYCYTFAQTSLVTNKIQAPSPGPGDSNGLNSSFSAPCMPTPYTGYYEYWDIQQQNAFMADRGGYANGAAAKTYLNANYLGGSILKWKVS